MRLLIDENVPDSVSEFLASRGHEVELVRERFGQMTPDQYIAWVGDSLSVIVVTIDKDFRQMVSRIPHATQRRFRRLGRISLRVRESQALGRVREFIEEIEAEHARVEARRDRRLIIEITQTGFRIVR
jgi:predicted nuclease of predicted toxin-antitoxin system